MIASQNGLINTKRIGKQSERHVPRAHACDLSFSGCRNHENYGSKPSWGSSLCDNILKKKVTKGWGSDSGVGHEFKSKYKNISK
jgi:hypothetical protein